MRDLGRSRAVLVGTWDYTHLPTVNAARHSLDRMRDLLTGDLCGWPADRVTVIANRRSPGDLHDMLVELFGETDGDGVALFYYVGHGQPDGRDMLCLGLVESQTDFRRRASTSLRFDDVRDALGGCDAGTKIVILDCCFAGLATLAPHTLSTGTVLDMTHGTGAYTMAASGAYLPAWFETDPDVTRPQTFFTKYLADVVEGGIGGEPADLGLGRIFAEVADRLVRDGRPKPTNTARHEAGRYVFARNACPAPDVDQPELHELRRRLAEAQTREADLLHRYQDREHRLRELQEQVDRGIGLTDGDKQRLRRQRDDAQRAVDDSAQATVAAHGERRRTRAALDEIAPVATAPGADPPPMAWVNAGSEALELAARTRPVGEVHEAVAVLAGAGMTSQAQAVLLAASGRPPAEVAALALGLNAAGRRRDAITMLRLGAHRPVGELTELAVQLSAHDAPAAAAPLHAQFLEGRAAARPDRSSLAERLELKRPLAQIVLLPAARRPVPELVALVGALRTAGNPELTSLLRAAGWQRPVPELVALAGALRAAGQGDAAATMLARAGRRPVDVLIPLIEAFGAAGPPHADLRAVMDDLPPLDPGSARAVAAALGRTSLPEDVWKPLLRRTSSRQFRTMPRRARIVLTLAQALCYAPVSFLLGTALAVRTAPPALSPWRWAFGAVSLVVVGYVVVLVQASVNIYIDDREPHDAPVVTIWKAYRYVLWLLVVAGLLAAGWRFGPNLGLTTLGVTLRDWLVWRF